VMKRDKLLHQSLAKLGLEIRFYSFYKGSDVNHYLKKNVLDAGIGGDMPAISLCAETGSLITSLINQDYSSIISSNLNMISELKGKKVAYAPGSNAHRMLLTQLAANGLSQDDVQMMAMDVDQMSNALKRGQIDAFAAWEPIISMAMQENPKIISIAKGLTTGYLYFSHTFALKNGPAIRHIVASQIRSMNWIRRNKANLNLASYWNITEQQKMTNNKLLLSVDHLTRLSMDGLIGTYSIGKLPEKDLLQQGRLNRQLKFLQRIGKIPSQLDWDKIQQCFDSSVIKEIIQNKAFYHLDQFELETTSQ